MNKGVQIPLFIVYFSAIANQNQVIIEQVTGVVGDLKAIGRTFFDIDPEDIDGSSEIIIRYIINKSKK